LGEARNEAIKKSQGEFIAFLDCDDLWMPEKLEKQIPLFSDLQVGLVICDTYFFNEKRILKQVYKKNKPPTGDVFRQLLGEYFVSLETAVLRRLALNSLDHWFDPRFNMIEEYDLFVRLGHRWHLAYVDEVLAKWRVHGNSWTWKYSAEFPKERELMLQKLNYLIPNFDKDYAKEKFFINRTCNFEYALESWKVKENRAARKFLQPYITSGLKWFLIYFCTWLPYQVFKMLWKMKGGIHP
jgi:glycosyltransferase involved in cell wall biosynthesis